MSSGFKTSPIPTIELTATLPSLTPPSTAMCEWQSMIPGVTNMPVASMTVAPAGTFTLLPTWAILPSRMMMVPFSMAPFVTVRMVACSMAITPESCAAAVAAAKPVARSAAASLSLFMVVLLEPRIAAQGGARARGSEFREKIGTGDRALHGVAFDGSCDRVVLRAASRVHGESDGKCVAAEGARGNGGSSERMGDRSGGASAAANGQVGGGLLGALFGGEREGPLSGQVALGGFLGFLRFLDFEFAAVHEHEFDLCLVVEQVAVGHYQVCNFAGVDTAHPVGHAVNLRGREGERAERGLRRKPRVNRLLHVFQHFLGPGEPAVIESEQHARFRQGRRRPRSAVADAQGAQRLLGVRVGVFFFLRPLGVDQGHSLVRRHGVRDGVALLHAVQERARLNLFRQPNGAKNLRRGGGGNQHRFSRTARGLERAQHTVVLGPLVAPRIVAIDGLRGDVLLLVEEHLPDVRDRTHQRAGETEESARAVQGELHRRRGLYHEVARPLAGQIN